MNEQKPPEKQAPGFPDVVVACPECGRTDWIQNPASAFVCCRGCRSETSRANLMELDRARTASPGQDDGGME